MGQRISDGVVVMYAKQLVGLMKLVTKRSQSGGPATVPLKEMSVTAPSSSAEGGDTLLAHGAIATDRESGTVPLVSDTTSVGGTGQDGVRYFAQSVSQSDSVASQHSRP